VSGHRHPPGQGRPEQPAIVQKAGVSVDNLHLTGYRAEKNADFPAIVQMPTGYRADRPSASC